jgi:hypothetical protein
MNQAPQTNVNIQVLSYVNYGYLTVRRMGLPKKP